MEKIGVIFMPTPGIGHLISTVEFAKCLLNSRDSGRFSVTVFTINSSLTSITASYIESVVSLDLDITFEELPPVEPPSTATTQKGETFVSLLIEAHKPVFKDAVSHYISCCSTPRVGAIVLDLFCTTMIDVANDLGLPSYIFFTSTAAMLSLMLYLPSYYLRDVEGNIDLPGLPPLPRQYLPLIMRDKNDNGCMKFLQHGQRFWKVKGIIVNTFAELEPASLKALADGKCLPDHPTPPVFAVGPLLAVERNNLGQEKHELIKWLDKQPKASVVFLCFGSFGCFGVPQIKEIADGLERSGHRFLWAIKSPPTQKFQLPTDSDLDAVLPDGFLKRTHGRGIVWPTWAPQLEILAHSAVGAFVTHCGWNSTLESLWFGVPMLGWPLYAEQRLNMFEMRWELGVALELEMDYERGGLVGSEEVERGVRELMEGGEEGKKVRKRVKEMKDAARVALREGGSSTAAVESFVQMLIKEMRTHECISQ